MSVSPLPRANAPPPTRASERTTDSDRPDGRALPFHRFYSSPLIETCALLAQGCGVRGVHARVPLRGLFVLFRFDGRCQRRVAHVRDECVYRGDGGRHDDGACLRPPDGNRKRGKKVAGSSAEEARPPRLRSIIRVGSNTKTWGESRGVTGICIVRARATSGDDGRRPRARKQGLEHGACTWGQHATPIG